MLNSPRVIGCGQMGDSAMVEHTQETANRCTAPWKIDAERRIEKYRKEDVELTVTAEGKPVPGADVELTMLRHEFLFGSNIFGWGTDPAYDRQFAELFNFATLNHWWFDHEEVPGKPDYGRRAERTAVWCAEHGIRTKSGSLMSASGGPAWLSGMSAGQVLKASLDHAQADVAQLKGKIDTWDLINELVNWKRHDDPNLMALVDSYDPVDVAKMSFAAVRDANPEGMFLINDYDVSQSYADLITKLTDGAGEPLYDAIGIQSHMHRKIWSNERMWELCERFGHFGKPLHFTELTVLSTLDLQDFDFGKGAPPGLWPTTPQGEAYQAGEIVRIYTMMFSHPSVGAITYWDFSDKGAWYGVPAGLIRPDMTPKPAYDALKKLIRGEWATNGTLTTNDKGNAACRAFRGTYRFTVTLPGGGTRVFSDMVTKGNNTITLHV